MNEQMDRTSMNRKFPIKIPQTLCKDLGIQGARDLLEAQLRSWQSQQKLYFLLNICSWAHSTLLSSQRCGACSTDCPHFWLTFITTSSKVAGSHQEWISANKPRVVPAELHPLTQETSVPPYLLLKRASLDSIPSHQSQTSKYLWPPGSKGKGSGYRPEA